MRRPRPTKKGKTWQDRSSAAFLVLCSALFIFAASLVSARTSVVSASATPKDSMHMKSAAALASSATVVMLHRRVVRVSIHNFAFKPARLVVSPGTRIIWTNTDSDPHTVSSDTGSWTSGALDTGVQFARTFQKSGSFHYHCKIHPFMHGTVTVQK